MLYLWFFIILETEDFSSQWTFQFTFKTEFFPSRYKTKKISNSEFSGPRNMYIVRVKTFFQLGQYAVQEDFVCHLIFLGLMLFK